MAMEEGREGGEEDRLLPPSTPTYDSSFAIFSDLEYSDDDEGDNLWDGEIGLSGSISSPETAALLDEIQKTVFPLQQPTNDAGSAPQSHLMHPLARQESAQSDGDDMSCLQYSLASEETKQSTPTNYGSVDQAPFDFKPASGSVAFRPPTSVFDSSRMSSKQKQSLPQYAPHVSPPRKRNLWPRPQSTLYGRHQGQQRQLSSFRGSPPLTPLPSMSSGESPVTSATATDATQSPPGAKEERDEPEKERITKLLSVEATKRLRRHRRLRRIKKAAEAREAAVQEVRGTEQDSNCNDALFAFIFLCQLLLVSMCAVAFGPGALRDRIYERMGYAADDDDDAVADSNPFASLQTDDIIINPIVHTGGGLSDGAGAVAAIEEEVRDTISHIDSINVTLLVCIASGYASLCSLLALGFMMMLSRNLLHVTLVFTVGVCAIWTTLGLALSASWLVPASGATALALSLAYTLVVWDRISFAATNLGVALKGMRSTLDIPFVGLSTLLATFFWQVWWITAFIGAFDYLNDDDALSNNWMSVLVLFFLFSYCWTVQVIKASNRCAEGISQTTVASIIGKWWQMSEDDPLPMCSSVLHSTLSGNIVGSFGSICLGSLIVGPCILLTRISTFSRLAKPKINSKLKTSPKLALAEESGGRPDAECTLDGALCTPQEEHSDGVISRNVNQWSYTYIGLYGYKFWESGSKASQLFEARGWSHVVSDDLIMTVMAMASMIIGGSTACLALIVEENDGLTLTSLNSPLATAFLIGLFVGFYLSSAFFSIIEGAVSAILVCYAAAPVEFHANHTKLSEEMKRAWKHFWLQKPAKSEGMC